MKDLTVVVYTMKGCPYCVQFKDMLKNNGIEFHDRDIHEHKEEYDSFVKITESDLIPAMMLIEDENGEYSSFLYVPDRDYRELTEAVDLVNSHKTKLGII